jgi:DNA-binding transcriptional regulator GbsR (MarR family)
MVENNSSTSSRFLDEANDIFIQGAGKISATLLGMINKVGGQIYALLFLSDEPLSLDDIANRLSVSKSNVSINIRMLEDYNLVRKVWVKGSRKDYYSAEAVYPQKVLRDFLEKIRGTLTESIATIERTRSKVLEAKAASKGDDKDRVEHMLEQLKLIGLFYYAASNFFEDFFEGKPVDVEIIRRVIVNQEDLKRR